MVGDQRRLNAKMGQQHPGMARVFRRDKVGFFEEPQRPQGDVFQVADGGCNDVEGSGQGAGGLGSFYCPGFLAGGTTTCTEPAGWTVAPLPG